MLKFLFSDKEYYRKMWIVTFPLVMQNIVNASVNLIDNLMVGAFGDAPLAAVNLSNQFYFFFNLLIYGAIAGGSILNAQYWGSGDLRNMYRVIGLQFIACFIVGAIFSGATFFIPDKIIASYTRDPEVIEVGASYLRTLSSSYILYAITQVYAVANRCTGNTKLFTIMLGSVLPLKTILSYLLIFGKFGFPKMGVQGMALTTVLARLVIFVVFIFLVYHLKKPAAVSPRDAFSFDKTLIKMTFRKVLPMTINEGLWGLGANVYLGIYAGISTASLAAYSAAAPIMTLMLALFNGLGDGCAVLVGNTLGAQKNRKSYEFGKRTVALSIIFSILIGTLVFFARRPILSIYNLSFIANKHAYSLLGAMCFVLVVRATNYTILIGTLRAGGDVRFSLFIDVVAMWLIGIPVGFVMAEVFHLPVTSVFLGIMSAEVIKLCLLAYRFHSRKWQNNLVC